ncbi:hypothetical protein [Mesorhizobium sp. WSM4906]|uniref:hypothetical protein n=1 Tax=Mesorhizobium sp. WSM4906 TaxID=3038546 RepID=UPI002417B3F3|nr:hypothetical protein [Mesorhizobium sp. WSM4906]WFP74739.1 hypothetical protein QAZ22_23810 [Mesorhizobium sp. WSM4906]
MPETFRGGHFERDALPEAMTQFARLPVEPKIWERFVRQRPPARGGAVGSWSATLGDPLAEVLVVRDEDFIDTLAWLNSYFPALSPVSQWCRILPESQAERIASRPPTVTLGSMLGAWVGVVLAECSVQAGGIQNLRDVPGSAAASTASFAAGRAAAVWSNDVNFVELARRHDELSQSLREGSRPLAADALVPLWFVLSGRVGKTMYSSQQALEPLISILSHIAQQSGELETAELVARTAMQARDYFDLPELTFCAQGPQVERVRALDRLAERLASGPRSPAIDALLGLGASFVDPGVAVAPELLRRHARALPLAPIWQGAFAGAMTPLRVMSDQGGLGRLVAKGLLAADDFQGRPSCDIAYEELSRWITPGRSLKLDVRGASARVLSVELVLGVTSAFPYGRSDITSPNLALPKAESTRNSTDRVRNGRSLQDLDFALQNLQKRIERLEEQGGNFQRSLALPEPKENRTRRSGRNAPDKKT